MELCMARAPGRELWIQFPLCQGVVLWSIFPFETKLELQSFIAHYLSLCWLLTLYYTSTQWVYHQPTYIIIHITKHKNTENTKFVYTKIWVHLGFVVYYDLLKWTTIICPKILHCTVSLKNCCQNFLKISSPPSLGSSTKCLQKKPFDVRTEEFGIFYSGVKLSHFIYLSSLAWLAAYLGAACLSIALIGFVAYAA